MAHISEYIMKSNLFTLSLVIDLNPDEATAPFGVKIVKADLPAGFDWANSSAMKRHSVLPLKAVKKVDESKKPGPAIVTKPTEVAAPTDNPLFAQFAAFMAAQGQAQVVPTADTTPTLAAARKPGRPRKA